MDDWVPWVLVSLAAILTVELWRRRGLPPGPWGLPLVGYYPFIKNDFGETFQQLAQKYGEIFSFRILGGTLVMVLNSRSVIKEVLLNRADEFAGKPEGLNFLNWIDDRQGIAQTDGQEWKEHRRFFLTTAKNFGFGKIELQGFLHDRIRELLKEIENSGGKSFEIYKHLSYVTYSAVAKIMCTERYSKDDARFATLSEGFRSVIGAFLGRQFFLVGLPAVLYSKFSSNVRKSEKSKRKANEILDGIIEEHIQTFDPTNLRDYVDCFLNQMKTRAEKGPTKGSTFTLKRLRAILFNMLMEGTESISVTICGHLAELSEHVEAQKRAQKELDEVTGRSRLPSWMDRPNTPYLEALISELHRLNRFITVGMFFNNLEETTIRGYRIPKKSHMIAHYASITHDPELFPNPSKFDPERFLGAEGKKRKQEGSVPFGVGKRACVGEALAQMEVYLIIAALLQNFTLYPGEKEGELRAEKREGAAM